MKYLQVLSITALIVLVPCVDCWPSGAPDKACSTLTPRHGENESKPSSTSPFAVTQSQSNFEAGDRVKGESK